MTDLIFGLHSIAEAINNEQRTGLVVVGTEDSIKDLRKLHFKGQNLPNRCEVRVLSLHKFKEEGKAELRKRDLKEQRIPSNIFLIAEALEKVNLPEVYSRIDSQENFKLLILDQVTDVHNLGAILRTAAFYDIDAVIYGKKGDEKRTPGFYRVASGAAEHTPLVQAANLSKVAKVLQDKGVKCLGLAEEREETSVELGGGKICLVMGAEETGISNALRRSLTDFVSLPAKGPIRSLNVSVAAALAMEKFLK